MLFSVFFFCVMVCLSLSSIYFISQSQNMHMSHFSSSMHQFLSLMETKEKTTRHAGPLSGSQEDGVFSTLLGRLDQHFKLRLKKNLCCGDHSQCCHSQNDFFLSYCYSRGPDCHCPTRQKHVSRRGVSACAGMAHKYSINVTVFVT